jgi:PhnB protein
MAVQPIPEGASSVSAYLAVEDARAAIDFYKRAFGATDSGVMEGPDGKVAHAGLAIGNSNLMLSDPFEQSTIKPPSQIGGTSVSLYLYVGDVDSVFQQALDAGATEISAPQDMFWGDRWGQIKDPFGHEWQIATHTEDLSPEEMQERVQEAMAGPS